jgi:hypothetical protein
MPLYRFNLGDHRIIADGGVRECLDDAHAKDNADEIAEQLVQNEPELTSGGHPVVVREHDTNRQIYRAEMNREPVESRRRSGT